MSKKILYRVLAIISALLLIIAAWIVLSRWWANQQADRQLPSIISAIRAQMPLETVEILSADAILAINAENLGENTVNLGNAEQLKQLGISPNSAWLEDKYKITSTPANIKDAQMGLATVAGKSYVGILEIPALELVLPVLSGIGKSPENIAPNLFYGNVYTNNLVIGGANLASQFGSIIDLPTGAEVMFTDLLGQRFHYRVLSVGDIGARDDGALTSKGALTNKSDPWDLTLFTPSFSRIQRIIVRCAAM